MIDAINSAFWILSLFNLLWAAFFLALWVIGWGIRFRWYENEISIYMWLFGLLLTLNTLRNLTGVAGNTLREWWETPPIDSPLWFLFGYIVSLGLAAITTAMDVLLVRRWRNKESIAVTVAQRGQTKTS